MSTYPRRVPCRQCQSIDCRHCRCPLLHRPRRRRSILSCLHLHPLSIAQNKIRRLRKKTSYLLLRHLHLAHKIHHRSRNPPPFLEFHRNHSPRHCLPRNLQRERKCHRGRHHCLWTDEHHCSSRFPAVVSADHYPLRHHCHCYSCYCYVQYRLTMEGPTEVWNRTMYPCPGVCSVRFHFFSCACGRYEYAGILLRSVHVFSLFLFFVAF